MQEEYQTFLREWNLNHPEQEEPTVEEWEEWFRVVYSNYQPKNDGSANLNKFNLYDKNKKTKAFGKT